MEALINDRVGLGRYQLQAFAVLCLVDANDGVELVFSSLLNPIIRAVFPHATPATIELLASIFYVGSLAGSVTSGVLADRYGRRRLITYGAVLQIAVSLLFYCAVSLEVMLLLRFCYGFSFGFTVALSTSMFAEISPAHSRGRGILLINFCISLGKLYAVALAYLFLREDLASSNWKLMMVCGGMPNVLVLLGSLYLLQESPRYLLMHQEMDKGLFVLQKMLDANGRAALTLEEEEAIRAEFEESSSAEGEGEGRRDYHSLLVLLEGKYVRRVCALVSCWMVINFTFNGQLVVEAFHLSSNSAGLHLSKYFLTVAGEIPSLLVSFYLIDHPHFGRRRSLILFFLAAAACHLAFAATTMVLLGSLARFFMKDVFQILYPLTTESFDTRTRTKGFGLCSGAGRIGAIVMPFVVMPLDRWSRGSVYVLFAGLSVVAAGVGWAFVEETMGRELDGRGRREEGSGVELQEVMKVRTQ